jgi:hypothetical protein
MVYYEIMAEVFRDLFLNFLKILRLRRLKGEELRREIEVRVL